MATWLPVIHQNSSVYGTILCNNNYWYGLHTYLWCTTHNSYFCKPEHRKLNNKPVYGCNKTFWLGKVMVFIKAISIIVLYKQQIYIYIYMKCEESGVYLLHIRIWRICVVFKVVFFFISRKKSLYLHWEKHLINIKSICETLSTTSCLWHWRTVPCADASVIIHPHFPSVEQIKEIHISSPPSRIQSSFTNINVASMFPLFLTLFLLILKFAAPPNVPLFCVCVGEWQGWIALMPRAPYCLGNRPDAVWNWTDSL